MTHFKSPTYATPIFDPDYTAIEHFLDSLDGGKLKGAYTHLQNVQNQTSYQVGIRYLCNAYRNRGEESQALIYSKEITSPIKNAFVVEGIYKSILKKGYFSFAFHILTKELHPDFAKAQYLGFSLAVIKYCLPEKACAFIAKLELSEMEISHIAVFKKHRNRTS